jgi:mRNA deadenylase 3'-5' endonuclease subunit Ccr4
MTSLSTGETKTTTDHHHVIRVVTWNTLANFWYVYKCYANATTPMHHRTWQHREQLSKDYLQRLNGDVVCLQEINPQHGTDQLGDLAIAELLGYNVVLEKSNNRFMRAAVLYRRDLYALHATKSDFKFVACRLIPLQGARMEGTVPIVVVSVHLPVGDRENQSKGQPQVLQKALKMANKIKQNHDALFVAGDFNLLENDGTNAPALTFLRNGTIGKMYEWEDNGRTYTYGGTSNNSRNNSRNNSSSNSSNSSSNSSSNTNTNTTTNSTTTTTTNNSKKKNYKHSMGPLRDAAVELNQLRNTFVVPDTNRKMYKREDANDLNQEHFVSEFDDAVTKIFHQFSVDSAQEGPSSSKTMTPDTVEQWLQSIHGPPNQRAMDGANQERLAKLKMVARATGNHEKWGVHFKNSATFQTELINEYENRVQQQDVHLYLNLEDFIAVYRHEYHTNPWSVQFDFVTLQVDWGNSNTSQQGSRWTSYSRALDRIFYNDNGSLTLCRTESQALLHAAELKKEQQWEKAQLYLPNSFHPSDHLAVTSDFQVSMASTVVVGRKGGGGGGGGGGNGRGVKRKQKNAPTLLLSVGMIQLLNTYGNEKDYNDFVQEHNDDGSKRFDGMFFGFLWRGVVNIEAVANSISECKDNKKKIQHILKARVTEILKQVR